GDPAPDPAEEVVPLPRRQRERALPGRPRLQQERRRAQRDPLLRAVEPAALRSLGALHRTAPAEVGVPRLPSEPGALPAQHRGLMRRRYAAAAALALAQTRRAST